MATAKIEIEGVAQISISEILCVCGKCGHHDRENATIEFNFREQKVLYTCSQCKKINEMQFGKERPQPYPRSRSMR